MGGVNTLSQLLVKKCWSSRPIHTDVYYELFLLPGYLNSSLGAAIRAFLVGTRFKS